MKRPLCVIGWAYFVGLLLAAVISAEYSLLLCGACAVSSLLCLMLKTKSKRYSAVTACLVAAVAVLVHWCCVNTQAVPVQSALENKTVQVVACLTDKPYTGGKAYGVYPVKTISIDCDGAPQEINLLLYTTSPVNNLDYFDTINCTVKFYSLNDSGSYQNYMASKGVFLSAYIDDSKKTTVTSVKADQKPLMSNLYTLRDAVGAAIDCYLPSAQAGMAKAVLLNDKTALSSDIKEDFSTAGVSHTLVVSGMHLSIVAAMLLFCLRKIFKGKKLPFAITIAGVLCYMAITSFSPSVVRSGIMMIIFLFGKLLGKENDSITNLGVAVLIISLTNPLCVGDIGLLMSVFATLGIIVLYPRLNNFIILHIHLKHFYKPIRAVVGVVCVSVSAVLFTLPVTVSVFGTFSVYFIISNLLITWVLPVLLAALILLAIFHFIPFLSFAAVWFAFAAGIICNYMIWAAAAVSMLPFAVVTVNKTMFYIWCGITALIAAVFMAMNKGKLRHKPYAAALSFAALIICLCINGFLYSDKITLTVADTGGNCVIAKCGDKSAVLYSGGNYRLLPHGTDSVKNEIADATQLLVIGDSNSGDNAVAARIINRFDVNNILVYDTKDYSKSLTEAIAYADGNVYTFSGSYSFKLWDNMQVILYADDDKCWEYIKIQDTTVLVCPVKGDFNKLPTKLKTADIAVISDVPLNIQQGSFKKFILTKSKESYTTSNTNSKENIFFTDNGSIEINSEWFTGEVSIWQK